MRDQQISDWVDEGLAALEGRHGLTIDDDDSGRFARAYLGHLRSRLNTPRAIKRYFTQVDSTISAVKGEVNTADLLLVTWLRSAEPVLYHALGRARSRLIGEGGVAEAVARMAGRDDVIEDREYWAAELQASKVRDEDAPGVAEIVGELFPRFQHAWFRTALDKSRLAEPGRISHRDYFDRYFAFAVPLEDISDALVGEAYDLLMKGMIGSALTQVTTELAKKPSLILTKLDNAYRAAPAGGASLLSWIRDNIHSVPDLDALLPPLKIAEALGQAIYESLQPAERLAIVRGATTDAAKLRFVASLVVRATTRQTREDIPKAARPRAKARRGVESFLAALCEVKSGGRTVEVDSIHNLLERFPVLVVFDGLDDVADSGLRTILVDEIDQFTRRMGKTKFDSPRRVRRQDSLEGSVSWDVPVSTRASFVSALSVWSPRCDPTIRASTPR